MQKPRVLFVCLIIFVFFLPRSICAADGPKNRVETMEPEALDRLIKSPQAPDMIAFMAAWCGPCIREMPILNSLYEKYKDEGFHIIGISLDLGGPAAMQPIVDKLKMAFPVYWVGETAVKEYKINALPMIFVIRDGNIVKRIHGGRSEKFLEKNILELLNRDSEQ